MQPTVHSVGDPVLQVQNVHQQYGGCIVLHNVTFSVFQITRPNTTQGRVITLLGKSGCGKTTLANIIAGLRRPTSGNVLVNHDQRPVRAGEVGFVFQDYIVFEHLTVIENLMLSAYQGMFRNSSGTRVMNEWKARLRTWFDKKILFDRVDPYLDDFNLRKHIAKFPRQLSGGTRQRLAILSQVLCSSHYIVLDEPFSGQDPVMKQRACEMLARIARLPDFETLIIITHDIECAVQVSDTLLIVGQDGVNDGSTIIRTCDLMEMNLAWQDPEICRTPEFTMLVNTIRYDWFPFI